MSQQHTLVPSPFQPELQRHITVPCNRVGGREAYLGYGACRFQPESVNSRSPEPPPLTETIANSSSGRGRNKTAYLRREPVQNTLRLNAYRNSEYPGKAPNSREHFQLVWHAHFQKCALLSTLAGLVGCIRL